MKFRLPLGLIACSVLAACANVQDIKKREPVFYGNSSKSAERYTECVAQAWAGLGASFKQNATHNGYDLVLSNSMGSVSAVLATTEWRGKVETTLTAQKSGLDPALVQAANLCL